MGSLVCTAVRWTLAWSSVAVLGCTADGGTAARSASGVGGRDSGTLPEATLPDAKHAARTDGALVDCNASSPSPSGDGSPSFSDLGDPPSDCVAPCVWELLRGCLPAGACIDHPVHQDVGTGVHQSLSCAPQNDWWSADYGTFTSDRREVYVGGAPCFAYYGSAVDGVFGSECVTWEDGAGTIRARVVWGSPLYCGTPKALEALGDCAHPNPDPTSTGAVAYTVDSSPPRCAPWAKAMAAAFGVGCHAGCCPGTPPVLPSPN